MCVGIYLLRVSVFVVILAAVSVSVAGISRRRILYSLRSVVFAPALVEPFICIIFVFRLVHNSYFLYVEEGSFLLSEALFLAYEHNIQHIYDLVMNKNPRIYKLAYTICKRSLKPL